MKSIVIIGGGIAGLTTGIFAQINGFQSTILEKHHTIGGECTGWDRQGYHIDGCIHWLLGTKEGSPLRRLWNFVGAMKGIEIYHPESFLAFEHQDVTVHFYRDLNRLKSSWLEISPEDSDLIEEMCKHIKTLQNFEFPVGKPVDMMNISEKVKQMLSMKDVGPIWHKYSKISIKDYAAGFKHPALRSAIQSFIPEGDYSAVSLLFPLGTFTGNQSSIPFGGSKALALRMAERYKSLGGIIKTSCEAIDLDINNGQVSKVLCRQGITHKADYYIAACDAYVLYHKLLKDKYDDAKFKLRYDNPQEYPLASDIYVGLGYQGLMEDIPRTLRFPVQSVAISQNAKPIEHLQMTHYAYERDFAPEGHTVITVAINQFEPELFAWEALAGNPEAYQKEKARIGEQVIKAIVARFPHMEMKLKLLDVATPQTYNRYCNAYRGAFMGFWPTIKRKAMVHTGNVKRLKNLVLTGQWLQSPGGLPVAVVTGRDTIMRLCRSERRPFVGEE